MVPWALLVLFLSLGTEIELSHATEVSVKDADGKLCLYADLMLNFTVTYEAADKNETVNFELPGVVATDGSVCGNTSSTLKLNFEKGHSWTVAFSKSDKTYQADSITFDYSLSDPKLFPDSISNETMSVTVKNPFADVSMDTCYSCKSQVVLPPTDTVKQTLWNVLMQAFVSDGSKSENITSCAADTPTTAAPTTVPTTPVSNATTAAPATTTPTTVPTTTPTPTLPPPVTGKYAVKNVENGTACLLATFGLRLSFKGEKPQEKNLDPSPNVTVASGTCGPNTSDLVLTSDTITIMFTFTNESSKFQLHALNVTGAISGANTNLSLWQAAVGSSYMCNKEQNFTITDALTLYTFDLRVQPFAVNKGDFSTAEECFLDSDLSFLVPIAVGVALSFLIILVLISYLIGRRKSRTGYQSV